MAQNNDLTENGSITDWRKCRKCLLRDMDDASEYESIKAYISRIHDKERTPDDIYAARLETCKACDSLLSGTCMKCGCYVEIRAALNGAACPNVPSLW